jgi:hypothetical protein
MKLIAPLSALLLAFLVAPAAAQETPAEETISAEPKVHYKAVTEIEIGDLDVLGAVKTPHGGLVVLRRAGQFRPLIQLRQDFDREMKDSADQIR